MTDAGFRSFKYPLLCGFAGCRETTDPAGQRLGIGHAAQFFSKML